MKIALIGSAPSSIHVAPYGTDWQIWGCSPGALIIGKHAHAWFELHRYEPGQPWFSEGYCDFLKNFDGPVYMAEHVPEIKNCVVLPVEQLVAKYSPYWFNSSISWMFAMAIEEKPQSIGLWGVDMAASEEYFSQKMGCIWFAQLAKSLGIEVGVSPYSDLFTPPPLYGVSEVTHPNIKITQRTRELTGRLQEAEKKFEESKQEVHFLRGALDDMNYMHQTWLANIPARSNQYLEPPLPHIIPEPVTIIEPPKEPKRRQPKGNGKEPPSVSQ